MAVEFPMWILGVILILLGSLGNNLGNNLVSLAHKETKDAEAEGGVAGVAMADTPGDATLVTDDKYADQDCKNDIECNRELPQAEMLVVVKECPKKKGLSMRTVGTLVFVFGNLFTFAAFGFGAQSLLASLESVQFVSNVVFAKYVHKEKITVRMLVATLSIVVGNVLVVIFSDHEAKLYTSRDIIYLYRHNTAYQAYLAIAGVLWFCNHFTYRHYYKARIEQRRILWNHSFVEPFTFTVSSAIIGTQAVLLSKCMSMLIQVSAYGDNEFNRPTIFVVLVSWLILVAYWLRRLDLGLSLYPPLFIIPVMQVFFVFFAIMCGGIYFEEFEGFNTNQYIGFVFGVFMILGGVYGLAPTDVLIIPPSKDKEGKEGEGGISNSQKTLLDHQFTPQIDVERPVRRGSAGGMVPVYSNHGTPIKAEDLFRAMSPGGSVTNLFFPNNGVTTSLSPSSLHVDKTDTDKGDKDKTDKGNKGDKDKGDKGDKEQKYLEERRESGGGERGPHGGLPPIITSRQTSRQSSETDTLAANKKKRKVVKRSPVSDPVSDDGSSSPLVTSPFIKSETVNRGEEYAL